MVLPVPGGPSRDRWWPPAAEISTASRASAWPSTSARSSFLAMAAAGAGPCGAPGTTTGDGGAPPRSQMITSARLPAPTTSTPGTRAASSAFCGATTTVAAPHAAATTAGSTPGTGRSRPSSPSSAQEHLPGERWLVVAPPRRTARIATAMARSKPEPRLGSAAGESPTVILAVGQLSPLLTMAARIRSRASRSAVSGRPTRIVAGSPLAMSASTLDEVPLDADEAPPSRRGRGSPSSTPRTCSMVGRTRRRRRAAAPPRRCGSARTGRHARTATGRTSLRSRLRFGASPTASSGVPVPRARAGLHLADGSQSVPRFPPRRCRYRRQSRRHDSTVEDPEPALLR